MNEINNRLNEMVFFFDTFIMIGIIMAISKSKITKIIIIIKKFNEILNVLNILLLNPHSTFQKNCLEIFFFIFLFIIIVKKIKIDTNKIIYLDSLIIFFYSFFLIGN